MSPAVLLNRSTFRSVNSFLGHARRSIISTPSSGPGTTPTEHQASASAAAFEGAAQPGLRMILFGKPGSGKGTLSQLVLEHYPDMNLVSVGDVLRKEIAKKSAIGRHAESLVARGDFVPDEVMLEITLSALAPLAGSDWILDGFPRTLQQGIMLDEALTRENRPLNLIVNLGVQDDTILRRIADRWVHVPSGRVYNSSYNKPLVEGKDDVTGEPLSKRPDDTPEIFSRRLDLYNKETFPLLHYYGTHYPDSLKVLEGESSDEIWPNLDELLVPILSRR